MLVLPKITKIEGGEASVTSPKFDLETKEGVLFLVGASETPLTVKVTGYKGEESKDISFKGKGLTDTDWTQVTEEGLNLETTSEFLVLVESDKVAHDEIESITLSLDGGEDGTTPETIFAFEIASRYNPQ
jgi:hypothetical protein